MKKGDLQISFGMIFSIILIIAFLGAAFYVIKIFLGLKNCAVQGAFIEDLQANIDKAWRSPETSSTISLNLPSSVDYVCFVDVDAPPKGRNSGAYNDVTIFNKNMILYPSKCGGLEGKNMNHINVTQITATHNPMCIETKDGKATLKIVKTLYERSVMIS